MEGLVVDSFAFAKAVRGSCPAAEPMPTGGRFMVEKSPDWSPGENSGRPGLTGLGGRVCFSEVAKC